MLHFVLCDDCAQHNQTVELLLREVIKKHQLDADIALVSSTPETALAYGLQHTHDSVYFLDLDFGMGWTGLDLARKIRSVDAFSYIVFISAHQEYLLDCFKVKASDFLVKPYLPEQLEQCVLGVFRDHQLMNRTPTLRVNIGSCVHFIPYNQIYYFEKQREYVVAHHLEGTMKWREGYASLQDRLSSDAFIRVHHGYVVNIQHVKHYRPAEKTLLLVTGQTLPVSRRNQALLEKVLLHEKNEKGINP